MTETATPGTASRTVVGGDIGTSSSQGVLVDLSGEILGTAVREHHVSRPAAGQVEMDADVWWQEFAPISRELTSGAHVDVIAVGVSGMGPCVLLTDGDNVPLRPARIPRPRLVRRALRPLSQPLCERG